MNWKQLVQDRVNGGQYNYLNSSASGHGPVANCTCCGREVPGMVSLRDLKGAVRLDSNNDMSAHVSDCNISCVKVLGRS
jgi:hypothetical protein